MLFWGRVKPHPQSLRAVIPTIRGLTISTNGIIGETPAELLNYDTLEESPKKRRPTGLHSKEATKRKAIVSPLSSTLPLDKFPLSGDDKTGAYCRQCGKFVSGLQRLRAHERYHEKSGRFKCRFCGKLFAGKGDMKRHERIHTGEKPYNCSVCERSFATLSNRRRTNLTYTSRKTRANIHEVFVIRVLLQPQSFDTSNSHIMPFHICRFMMYSGKSFRPNEQRYQFKIPT
ncbi:putative zinc finger protein [Apostichopus japonicus]|uniref:Putative zinc finger protein n=1 Tax=Stichopus japonicus TaxID=307972 RepID=A0A2G8L947_STIJA|nr:putative zinc finger protein [Apostichopus japonicus]